MYRTVKLLLQPVESDCFALRQTLEQFTVSFNRVAQHGFTNNLSNGVKLHHATYKSLRKELPDLPSNLLIQARVKAAETIVSVFSLRKKGRKVSQPVCKLCPVRYNERTMNLKWDKQIVSLSTINGRKKIPFVVPRYAAKYVGNKPATADLIYRNGSFWLHVVLEIKTPDFTDSAETVGVDFGIARPAVTSKNLFLGERHWRELENRTFRLRRALQSKGTKSAKRHLKKLSGKQLRRRKDHDHVLSKSIVQSVSEGTSVVIEDLTNIRKRVRGHKGKQQRRLHNWSFARLREYLTYKAEERGIRVVAIDPRKTSQTCSCCRYVHRHNRKTQSRFVCRSCGFELNADLNASRNMRLKFLAGAAKCDSGAPPSQSAYRSRAI